MWSIKLPENDSTTETPILPGKTIEFEAKDPGERELEASLKPMNAMQLAAMNYWLDHDQNTRLTAKEFEMTPQAINKWARRWGWREKAGLTNARTLEAIQVKRQEIHEKTVEAIHEIIVGIHKDVKAHPDISSLKWYVKMAKEVNTLIEVEERSSRCLIEIDRKTKGEPEPEAKPEAPKGNTIDIN